MAGDSDRYRTEHTTHKCFRWGYVDHLIAKCTWPTKDNKNLRKTVCYNEWCNISSQKESNNSGDYNDRNIYISMARMSGIDERLVAISVIVHNWPIRF